MLPAVDEEQRLERLYALAVLDSAPEPLFDSFARIALEVFRVPIALVTLVDRDRVWFKSNFGLPGCGEARREAMFCSQTILADAVMVVSDALSDRSFVESPLVTGGPAVRFYAGAPIIMAGGERLGTVCVMDRIRRDLDDSQRALLTELAQGVSHALSMRERSIERGLSITSRFASSLLVGEKTLRRMVDAQTAAISAWGADGRLRYANHTHRHWFGSAPEARLDRIVTAVLDGEDVASCRSRLDAIRAGQSQIFEGRLSVPLGEAIRVHIELILDREPTDGTRGWVCTISEVSKVRLNQTGQIAVLSADMATTTSIAHWQGLHEAIPAMVHSIDETGRLISVSDPWLEKLGYSRQEVIGRQSVEFLTPASRRLATDVIVPQFFATGFVKDVSYQMERKDGTAIDVVMSAVTVYDNQGRFQQSLAVMEDVTARKLAEERLRASAMALAESEARLRLVVDNIPALVAYIDHEQRYRFSNRTYALWYGITGDAILGRTVREIIGDENHARFQPAILKSLSGEPVQREGWVTGHSGTRWANVTLVPHRDDSDRVVGAYVFIVDRTATRQAELKLIENEQRLQTIIDNVPAMIGYWGQDGRCIFGNRAYADWFGTVPEKLPGITPVELLGERIYALSQEHFAAVLRGESRFFERSFIDQAGVPRHIHVSFLPDISDDAQRGFFAFAVDVTELNRMVDDRTRELNIAKDAAERASRVKDEIIANVSHEMRTPLHSIISFSTLGDTRLAPDTVDKCRSYFQRIHASGKRLVRYVDQILDLARLASGEVRPHGVPTDLSQLVHRIADDVRILFDEKGCVLNIVSNTSTSIATVDPNLIEQVLLNLLANARHYSPQGGIIDVILEDATRSDAERWMDALRITVADNGPGIPASELQAIFEPFVQSSMTSSKAGGTGLGLSIVKRIVVLHGGSVTAHNRAPHGAAFEIVLPKHPVLERTEEQ